MSLSKSIIDLCVRHLDENNDWYTWKINEKNLPLNISLPDGNLYVKNIALKQELKKWMQQNPESRKEIIPYYIAEWGGVKTNSPKTLHTYIQCTPEQLISLGKKGIASWSKALTIYDPETYAIFDARVSISLNYLQIIHNTRDKILYPVLSSRNKKIVEGSKYLKILAKKDEWRKANEVTFYQEYLTMLKNAAQHLACSISTVEMLLFAKAEELVDEGSNR